MSAPDPTSASENLEILLEGSNGVIRIHLNGELDMWTAPLLAEALDELTITGPRRLVVDMTELYFMDRAGLAALSAVASDRTHQFELAVTGCRPNVRRVFELTGLEELISENGSAAAGAREPGDGQADPG